VTTIKFAEYYDKIFSPDCASAHELSGRFPVWTTEWVMDAKLSATQRLLPEKFCFND